MSVLIKDMEKPKSCYAVIDGESKYCPFVNTDDDCVLQLEKGICEGTWADQYSKCPLIETHEPCEDAVSRMIAIKTSLKELPEFCDDCQWYACRPHPHKGWTELCELECHCMDDDQPREWIYDGNGRPEACPLIEVER